MSTQRAYGIGDMVRSIPCDKVAPIVSARVDRLWPRAPEGQELVRRWAHRPRCVGRARAELRKALAGWGLAAVEDAALVVVSELVSNAVQHADVPPGRQIETRYQRTGSGVRIEVHDASEQWPERRSPGADADDGRGLLLVSELADSWGVSERIGVGKLVWAVVTADGAGHMSDSASEIPPGNGQGPKRLRSDECTERKEV